MASWISMNASESRPMSSNVASRSSTTSASGRPTRSTRIRLRSSNSNFVCSGNAVSFGSGFQIDRCAERLQCGQLLQCRSASGGEEQVGEVEVSPMGRPETRRDHHVGELGVTGAGLELAEVHHLQQRVECAAPTLPLAGGLELRLL